MLRVTVALFAACTASLFAGPTFAGNMHIYKWVDSQGVVHYSDHAPATPQPDLKLMTLKALPASDPKALAEDQAWIASINKWYHTVLNDEAQLEYEQLLDAQATQPPASVSPSEQVEQVSYVTPMFGGYYHFHHHRYHHPLLSPPTLQSFQNSLWSTQPNPFSQQLYKP